MSEMDFQKIEKLRNEVRNENWIVVEVMVDEIYHKNKQRSEPVSLKRIVKWQDVNKEMPDTKHIDKRTQFLLKGAYGTPGRLGATCYIVSRLDEAAYTCGDEIVYETPVGFIPEKWQHIK